MSHSFWFASPWAHYDRPHKKFYQVSDKGDPYHYNIVGALSSVQNRGDNHSRMQRTVCVCVDGSSERCLGADWSSVLSHCSTPLLQIVEHVGDP